MILAVVLLFYVLLTLQVRKGKNWARITTWVFAGLGVLGALLSLTSTITTALRATSIVDGLIDLVIIVLLASGESNRFFKQPQHY